MILKQTLNKEREAFRLEKEELQEAKNKLFEY